MVGVGRLRASESLRCLANRTRRFFTADGRRWTQMVRGGDAAASQPKWRANRLGTNVRTAHKLAASIRDAVPAMAASLPALCRVRSLSITLE